MIRAADVGSRPTRAERARLEHDLARQAAILKLEDRPQDVMWKRGRP